jgi:hypothetical protein
MVSLLPLVYYYNSNLKQTHTAMRACVCVFGCARAIFYLGVFLFLFMAVIGEFKLS